MSLVSKRAPACLAVAAMTSLTIPTKFGTFVKIATKLPSYMKMVKNIKASAEDFINVISQTNTTSTTAPTAAEEKKTTKEVTSDMGG